MPSPIAHSAIGYAIYRQVKGRKTGVVQASVGPSIPLLMLTAGLSLLPDLDAVAGVVLGDFGRFHNNGTHSLLVGFALGAGAGLGGWLLRWRRALHWAWLVFICYQFHIIMDYFTVGRGVMLFWPISSVRFEAPAKLFYGLRWSHGVWSSEHLITLISELGFAALIVLVLAFIDRLRVAK